MPLHGVSYVVDGKTVQKLLMCCKWARGSDEGCAVQAWMGKSAAPSPARRRQRTCSRSWRSRRRQTAPPLLLLQLRSRRRCC